MALAMTFLCALLNAQLHPDYENPSVFERNQELPHTTLMPYPDSDLVLEGKRKASPFHQKKRVLNIRTLLKKTLYYCL